MLEKLGDALRGHTEPLGEPGERPNSATGGKRRDQGAHEEPADELPA